MTNICNTASYMLFTRLFISLPVVGLHYSIPYKLLSFLFVLLLWSRCRYEYGTRCLHI